MLFRKTPKSQQNTQLTYLKVSNTKLRSSNSVRELKLSHFKWSQLWLDNKITTKYLLTLKTFLVQHLAWRKEKNIATTLESMAPLQ